MVIPSPIQREQLPKIFVGVLEIIVGCAMTLEESFMPLVFDVLLPIYPKFLAAFLGKINEHLVCRVDKKMDGKGA